MLVPSRLARGQFFPQRPLCDLFSGSLGSDHVKTHSLDRDSDEVVWKFAQENGFAILTKDWDFHQMSLVRGFPPKLIFLKIGNCSTDSIISLIRLHQMNISAFLDDKTASLLILGK